MLLPFLGGKMRYLKPYKPVIEINNNRYELIYSLEVIDEIQDKTQLPMIEVISMLFDYKTREAAVKLLIKYLTGQIIAIKENELESYSILLLNTYIEQIKSKEIKGNQAKEKPNGEHEFIDVERLFYIGTVVLNRPEEKVWAMTVRELRTLHNEHAAYNGWIKEEEEQSLLKL